MIRTASSTPWVQVQSDTDSFTYTIDDGNGGTDTATVTITINGTNDAPVIGGVTTGSVTEDDAATLTGVGCADHL
jgi:VCBS repeat-containing protein